jgi:hypothetical protein
MFSNEGKSQTRAIPYFRPVRRPKSLRDRHAAAHVRSLAVMAGVPVVMLGMRELCEAIEGGALWASPRWDLYIVIVETIPVVSGALAILFNGLLSFVNSLEERPFASSLISGGCHLGALVMMVVFAFWVCRGLYP